MTPTRTLVMLPGHCSACMQPAERNAVSRRWWHLGEVCEWRSTWAFFPLEITQLGDGGVELAPLRVDLPARFIPEATP